MGNDAKSIIQRHVSPDPPIECLKELTRLFKEGNFGWEFFSHLSMVMAWVFAWAAGGIVDPAVFGANGDRTELYGACCELLEAVTGKAPTYEGPIADAIIAKLFAQALNALIDNLMKNGPSWLVDILKDLLPDD